MHLLLDGLAAALGWTSPAASKARLALYFTLTCLSLAPTALAQAPSHRVAVTVPSYIGLRIVGAGSGPRSVTFVYAANSEPYVNAISGNGSLLPTSVARFDDVEVNMIGFGRWSVYVEATPLDYTGTGTGSGLDLSDVRMVRGGASGLTQNAISLFWFLGTYDSAWTLSTTPQRIARSWLGTGGWRSLGFNGWDYTLAVDGDEDAGTYATTVTYFLTFP